METCYYCGGGLRSVRVEHVHPWRGELYIFDQVPVEQCDQCGEQYFAPDVLREIDRLVTRVNDRAPDAVRSVPVFSFGR